MKLDTLFVFLRTDTVQKIKFSIKDFFSKCDQIRMVIFTDEILNGKLHFLCGETPVTECV